MLILLPFFFVWLPFSIPLGMGLACFLFLSGSIPVFNSSLSCSGLMIDAFSVVTVFMLVLVMFVSYLVADLSSSLGFQLSMSLMFVACFVVFTTDNLFFLYVFFEMSLVPIMYIILKWGSYYQRSVSTFMLLSYTAVFSVPFLAILFLVYFNFGSFSFLLVPEGMLTGFLSFIAFMVFAVKLPIYGVHFWLPMAHVEAPTFGSMLLAGVLLKLGGAGLVRAGMLFDYTCLSSTLFAYLLVSLLVSSVLCSVQSDFKRLVAYSSVVHIMVVPFLVICCTSLSSSALLMVLFFHGLSSPALFLLVGTVYSIYGSRQLIFIRGLFVCFPVLGVISVLLFFFTLPAPPFPSFLGEVFFVVSAVAHWGWFPAIYAVIAAFVLLAVVINVSWLSSLLFLAPLVDSKFFFSYRLFFSFFVFIFFGFLVCLVLNCF